VLEEVAIRAVEFGGGDGEKWEVDIQVRKIV